ncbi:MAG: LytTR family DNA-binding domain-containing protein [Hymenobacteraceae bacterium]|nr:LytTR family DNA-binding domain-containing protein [Hymenobacteraceae bacterium]MDX5396499.1 LytTR family DNA-binding domain-containing protein [Hymenobacteraceae bacterium]MDX5443727.1 LytTR family DNA-binding domain-containing protein [Hymenobacteraceae bacterium]MDX5512563.1 LytTR family DNA-binding domain-containing protein [Hymenobacteraceae bacterium]
MQVLIIEDEAPAARRLQQLLRDQDSGLEIADTIDSVESAVKWLNRHQQPDLIFMDIQLADGLSFEIFDQVAIRTPVIFTTAYDEYAIRAFSVNSIDYLLKPIEPDHLKRSLQKYRLLKEQFGSTSGAQPELEQLLRSLHLNKKSYKNRFLVRQGERLLSVPAEEVAYFMAEDKIVLLCCQNNLRYPVDFSLDELESLLDPQQFFRINRQFIVSLSAIEQIHTYFNGKLKLDLQPEVEKEVLISREKAAIFKQWLGA